MKRKFEHLHDWLMILLIAIVIVIAALLPACSGLVTLSPPGRHLRATTLPPVFCRFDRPALAVVDHPAWKLGLLCGAYNDDVTSVDFLVTADGQPRPLVTVPRASFSKNDQLPEARDAGEPAELRAILPLNPAEYALGARLVVTATAHAITGADGVATVQLWNQYPRHIYSLAMPGAPADFHSIAEAEYLADPGALVLMKGGKYTGDVTRYTGFRDSGGKYLTFAADTGLSVGDVVTTFQNGNDEPRAPDLEWRGLTLLISPGVVYQGSGHQLLVDCVVANDTTVPQPAIGANLQSVFQSGGQSGLVWAEGCTFQDFPYAPLTNPAGVSGCAILRTSGHPINGGNLVTQTLIDGVGTNDPNAHIDAIMLYNGQFFYAGLQARGVVGLDIYGEGVDHTVLRDIHGIAAGIGVNGASQIGKILGQRTSSFIYVEGLLLENQRFVWVYGDPATDPANYQTFTSCSIRNSQALGGIQAVPGVRVVAAGKVPAPAVAGDVNGDGLVTWADVLLVAAAIGGTDNQMDLNGDGRVDAGDLAIVVARLPAGGRGWILGDLNGDGRVDASDFNLWFKNVGRH